MTTIAMIFLLGGSFSLILLFIYWCDRIIEGTKGAEK